MQTDIVSDPNSIPVPYHYVVDMLSLAIAWRLSLQPEFYFVQIGANNGVRFDPLYSLVKHYHLPGLLVEPLPDMFEELKRNYQSESQLRFENVAVSRESGQTFLYRFHSDASIGEAAQGMASFDDTLIRRKALQEDWQPWITREEVVTMSYSGLLEKHRIDAIALLQVDVEGFDFEIVKMALSHDVHPDIINFEFKHLSKEDRLASRQMLIKEGYKILDWGTDTLAIKQTLLEHGQEQ